MSYPYCYSGPTCQLEPFFTMKCKKQPALVCPIGVISEQVLNRWRCLVAFMKAMNLFQWAMCVVYYRRIAMTIETAIKSVHITSLLCLLSPWQPPER